MVSCSILANKPGMINECFHKSKLEFGIEHEGSMVKRCASFIIFDEYILGGGIEAEQGSNQSLFSLR